MASLLLTSQEDYGKTMCVGQECWRGIGTVKLASRRLSQSRLLWGSASGLGQPLRRNYHFYQACLRDLFASFILASLLLIKFNKHSADFGSLLTSQRTSLEELQSSPVLELTFLLSPGHLHLSPSHSAYWSMSFHSTGIPMKVGTFHCYVLIAGNSSMNEWITYPRAGIHKIFWIPR